MQTKKKRKPSTDLVLPRKMKKSEAVALPPAKQRISKLKTTGMRSIIGDSVDSINQLLEKNDSDSATALLQKRLIQGVLDMIPYAEHNIRKTKGQRGVYQMNSLITSLRELMIDVQSTKDKGQLGDMMVEKVIRPAFLDIGMLVVLEDERMLKEIKELVDINTFKQIRVVHQEGLKRMANTIQEKYAESKQGAIAFMQR